MITGIGLRKIANGFVKNRKSMYKKSQMDLRLFIRLLKTFQHFLKVINKTPRFSTFYQHLPFGWAVENSLGREFSTNRAKQKKEQRGGRMALFEKSLAKTLIKGDQNKNTWFSFLNSCNCWWEKHICSIGKRKEGLPFGKPLKYCANVHWKPNKG